MKTKLRAQLDDHEKASQEAGLDTGTEGGAKQSFKDECDINVILKRFGVGYEMPAVSRVPEYGDFTGLNNYHEAATALRQAQENFDAYPAHIRARFDNDPAKFHDFAVDRKNEVELADLGLLSEEARKRVRNAQEQRKIADDAKAAERHAKRSQPLSQAPEGPISQTPKS